MGNMRQGYDRSRGTMCDQCESFDRDSCPENRRYPVDQMPIAMAYVPWQEWGCVFEANEGLKAGTIFKELDLEFYGTTCGLRRGERT
mgnify:CR=1 FL=1